MSIPTGTFPEGVRDEAFDRPTRMRSLESDDGVFL